MLVCLFLVTGTSIAESSIDQSKPVNGNYVPADLSIKIHPFLKFRDFSGTFRRGTLLKNDRGRWVVQYDKSGELVTREIESTSINLTPLPSQKELPVLVKFPKNDDPIVIDFDRTNRYLVIGLVSIIFCLLVGGWITARSLSGIIIGFVYLFYIGLPYITDGGSILLHVCVFYVITTIIILPCSLGVRRESLAAIATSLITGLISLGTIFFLVHWIGAVGLRNETFQLLEFSGRYLPEQISSINLRNLLVGASLIGSLGVILDVSVDVTSSAAEITRKRPDLGIAELLKRTFTVSRRLVGTMTNTLLLAYVGTNLFLLLTLFLLPAPGWVLLNKDLVAVEAIRALGGAIGFLMAVPLAVVCYRVLLHSKQPKPPPPSQ